jgi:protein phosphatase
MSSRTKPPPPSVDFAIATDRGMVRADNQDAAGKCPEGPYDPAYPAGQLFIVADGMGGHNAGREASALALATIGEAFCSAPRGHDAGASLKAAFEAANAKIHEQGMADSARRGMGTTCTALLIKGSSSIIAHVGDSRAYLVTDSRITQLTVDHTRVGELVRAGVITAAQARHHPERSFLDRALGARPAVAVDIVQGPPIAKSCSFVLCSDGLYSHVDDDEILSAVSSRPAGEAAESLIALANERGGSDNITVLVVGVTAKRARPAARRARARRPR